MSDQYYREQAAQRARRIWLIAGAVLVFACAGFALFNLFFDSCTRSFSREPEQVVRNYVAAVSRGEETRARDCWQHDPYYDPEAGCSEACLANLSGRALVVSSVIVPERSRVQDGKLNLPVTITGTCAQTGEQVAGEIVLATIEREVPWRHWQIVSSTWGGALVDPWCK